MNMNIRRSPRLNPPPRRSPRIKEQSESEAEEDSTPHTILPEKQSTTTENDDATPLHSPRPREDNATKTKSPSSSVKFRRTRIVQNFDGNEPANRIHRRTLTQNKSSNGKRLFRESSGEYPQGNRSKKRIKNSSNNKPHQQRSVFKDHPYFFVGVGAAMLTIAIGKVLGWW